MMTRGIGDNSGDIAIIARDELDDKTGALLTVVRDACREPAPDTITDHDGAARVTARLGVLAHLGKTIDEAHKAAKAPHLAAGRACDAWKDDARRPLDTLATALKSVLTDYQRAMAEQERRRREQAAETARQFADMSGDKRADYLASSMEADAAMPDSDMSRVRARTGAMASLRSYWDFEVTNPALVPREYLMVNEPAVRAALRADVREIPGIRIFDRQKTVVRA